MHRDKLHMIGALDGTRNDEHVALGLQIAYPSMSLSENSLGHFNK